jgi:hypothetical protein
MDSKVIEWNLIFTFWCGHLVIYKKMKVSFDLSARK